MALYVPVQDSDKVVRVTKNTLATIDVRADSRAWSLVVAAQVELDQLPEDTQDLVDLLKVELAPLNLWLRFAVTPRSPSSGFVVTCEVIGFDELPWTVLCLGGVFQTGQGHTVRVDFEDRCEPRHVHLSLRR